MGLFDDINTTLPKQNPYLSGEGEALKLLVRLLEPPVKEPTQAMKALDELKSLVKVDFVRLISTDAFPNEAEQYQKMLSALTELEELAHFPKLARRHLVALGGAFSSGKSSMLNHLLGIDVLPVALRPTTAVPTYLLPHDKHSLSGLTVLGSEVELDADAVHALGHAFAEKFEFQLNTLLKRLHISCESELFSSLAFLDTPGYSAADDQTAVTSDESIAREALGLADQVIWVADADKGHLSATDLEFLSSIPASRPILVIFNKADMKTARDRERIRETAMEVLCQQSISVNMNVMLYSDREEAACERDMLLEFLDDFDDQTRTLPTAQPLFDVLDAYAAFYEHEIEANTQGLDNVLRLTIGGEFGGEQDKEYFESLQSVWRKTKRGAEERQQQLRELRRKIEHSVKRLGDALGVVFEELGGDDETEAESNGKYQETQKEIPQKSPSKKSDSTAKNRKTSLGSKLRNRKKKRH